MSDPYNSSEPQPWKPVESIPLTEISLCVDCKQFVRTRNQHCEVCGSHSIMAPGEDVFPFEVLSITVVHNKIGGDPRKV